MSTAMSTAKLTWMVLTSALLLVGATGFSGCSSGTGPGGGAGGAGGRTSSGGAGASGGATATGSAGTGAGGVAGAAGAAGATTGAAGTGAAGAGAAGTSGAGGDAGSSTADAAPPVDANAGGDAPGAVACGTEKPDVTGIAGSEGLVIDADGTIYFSQAAAVGRLRPGAASKLEKAWAKLAGAATVWGLALDRTNKVLYAGSPSTSTIYKVTLEDTPTVSDLVTKAGAPNGLTMGPDGALYYTDFVTMGDVYRVTADGTRTKVTTTTIAMPNGLAFGADGALYVDVYAMGAITKLTLAAGSESARADFVAKGIVNAADGLAFDAAGNAYVGFGGGVSRVSADGKTLTNLAKGGAANVEFGAGALDCKDIYYVTGGKIARVANDVAGAPVPWHVARP
jgi:sugar lactone lactonase YvrE